MTRVQISAGALSFQDNFRLSQGNPNEGELRKTKMKCPKCNSSRISETKKQGEIACETCGYVFEEHEAAKFREETKPGKK